MKKERLYIRKQRKGWAIEGKVDGKTKHICTLPPLKEVAEWVACRKKDKLACKSTKEVKEKPLQKFVETLLDEPIGFPTEEEITRSLWENRE